MIKKKSSACIADFFAILAIIILYILTGITCTYKAQQNTNLNTIVFKLHLDLETSLHGVRAMR